METEPPIHEKRENPALADLLMLRARLRDEGEDQPDPREIKKWHAAGSNPRRKPRSLLAKLACCQEPVILECPTCKLKKEVTLSCKRKWCPCCARRLAADRAHELSFIVERMRSPIFATLTMRNVADLSSGGVQHLNRAFGKLRHRKFWKRCVRGGIATTEITNIGNGWHPHKHCVVEAAWLSDGVAPPRRWDSDEKKQQIYEASAQSIERHWSKCLKQETSSIEITRANRETIAQEVVKYTVKGQDLIECAEPIGDLIRALDSCRMMTTFGIAHGQCIKDIRLQAKRAARDERELSEYDIYHKDTCPDPMWIPNDGETHVAQQAARAMRCKAA